MDSKQGALRPNRAEHESHSLSASSQKVMLVLDGASRFDLYDKPQYVEKAVAKLTECF